MESIGQGLSIDLPLPKKELHPNGGSRHHFGKIARLKKSVRQTAYYITLAALNRAKPPQWEDAELTLHFYFGTNRNKGKRDKDNLIAWCKSTLDGVADAGIVANDRCFRVPTVIEEVDLAHPRLIVTVEAAE